MNAKIAKASRMARRKKPKKAGGGEAEIDATPILAPRQSPADVAPIREGLGAMAHEAFVKPVTDAYKVMTNPSAMSDQEQENFGVGQLMNVLPMGKGAIMVGALGARALTKGVMHPAVAADMARQAKLPPKSIEETGVGAYKNMMEGRLPDPAKPMGDIQAQGVLDYRQGIGNPSDEGVWGKSAWFRGADGKSRKELIDLHSGLERVDDLDPTRLPGPGGEQMAWRHPAGDVHAAYKMPPVVVQPGVAGPNAAGSYDPMTGAIAISQSPYTKKGVSKASGIAPHEVQHHVQGKEGFAVGSNPSIEPLFDDYYKRLGYVAPADLRVRGDEAADNTLRHWARGIDPTSPEMTTYRRSAGEVEARNVQRRREKSYLYQKHPAETEDVPRDQQIVRKQPEINDQITRVNQAMKNRKPGLFADGGMPATPWFVRNEARNIQNTTGGLHSPVAGRTDHLPIKVPSGSYVLPADVVSGLGQGNTTSGMKVLGSMFSGGPFGSGMKAPKMGGGKSIPKPPKPMKFAEGGGIAGIAGLADEGDAPMGGGLDPSMDQMPPDDPSMDQGQGQEQDGIDIMAAGGEYVIDPEIVAQLGNGDLDLGHEILDEFVKSIRKDTVKELKTLPGPVKD